MTDAELADLREEMDAQRDNIRDYLESEGVDVSAWDERAAARADGGDDGTAQ
ncbi:MAG: hypothetical protein ABEJ31_09025 [Haloarculaceae archaeon]